MYISLHNLFHHHVVYKFTLTNTFLVLVTELKLNKCKSERDMYVVYPYRLYNKKIC